MRASIAALCLLSLCVAVAPVSAATCGNGRVEDGESCDDGNVHAGDCCSPTCRVEESYLGCAGGCLCDTCGDGLDNDEDGLVDAGDPECATLSSLQSVRVAARSGTVTAPGGAAAADRVSCLAERPVAAWDSTAAVTCQEASDLASSAGVEVSRLIGAPLQEISVSQGESVLSFDEGTSILEAESVELAGEARLRLYGSTASTVVIQVFGGFALGRGARVVLEGGLRPERVLWNLIGGDGPVRLAENSSLPGTLLAPEREVDLACRAEVGGAVYAGRLQDGRRCQSAL